MQPNSIPAHLSLLSRTPYPAGPDHYCRFKVGRRAWRLFACPACPIRRKRMNGRRGLRTADCGQVNGHTSPPDADRTHTTSRQDPNKYSGYAVFTHMSLCLKQRYHLDTFCIPYKCIAFPFLAILAV